MNGILIYTASGDSEGTLGGLVAQAAPNRFERLVDDALRRASWCSNDPVCMESPDGGPTPRTLPLAMVASCFRRLAAKKETGCSIVRCSLAQSKIRRSAFSEIPRLRAADFPRQGEFGPTYREYHKRVAVQPCTGRMPLEQAQREIAADWIGIPAVHRQARNSLMCTRGCERQLPAHRAIPPRLRR
jgi:hypothetical protein